MIEIVDDHEKSVAAPDDLTTPSRLTKPLSTAGPSHYGETISAHLHRP
jgi:hypothetical protein